MISKRRILAGAVSLVAVAASAAIVSGAGSANASTPYCAVKIDASPAKTTCFSTFGDSIALATGGKVHLTNAATSRAVAVSELAGGITPSTSAKPNVTASPAASYVLAIDYVNGSHSGQTFAIYASSPCGTWYANTLPSFMDKQLTSFTNYSGCADTLFPGQYESGQPVFLSGVGASIDLTGNSFNDKTRSQEFCNHYGCS